MGKVEQWVNLEKDPMYVADGIPSKERLGELQYEVTFKKAALAHFKVKVEPVGTPAAYTPSEKRRNARFDTQQTSHQTNVSKKKLKIDHTVVLPAAGGNEFRVKAKFKGKVIEAAKTLGVRRKLFYQVMQMQGVTATTTTGGMEQTFWNPGKNYCIKMKREGGVPNIPFLQNIFTNSDHNTFITESKKAFSLGPKRDFALAVAYVNYIAEPRPFRQTFVAPVSVGSRILGSDGKFITLVLDSHLWYGLNSIDDKNKAWLDTIRMEFQEAGTSTWVMVPLSDADCDLDTSAPDFPYGGHRRIRVHLSSLGQNWFSRKKGKVQIRFRGFTPGWINGFAYNDRPLIAMATKVLWRDQVSDKLAYTLNHEVGHKIGMVPDGSGLLPDQPPDYYVNKNHRGPHCEKGAIFTVNNWSGKPACVMFGADGVWNAGAPVDAPATFCADCDKAVRKMDLHKLALQQAGWKNPL